MNCLQKVRDVPVICGILGLLQYPSFARANTVSESHYARTMSSGVRFHYRTLCKYLQIVRESCDCLRYTGIVIVSEFCKSNHSFRFLTIHIHYVRRAFAGIEKYHHSYGSYRINQSTVFKTVLFFCLHSLLPEGFAVNFPILIQEVVRMLTVLVPSIFLSVPILEFRHYTSGGSQ